MEILDIFFCFSVLYDLYCVARPIEEYLFHFLLIIEMLILCRIVRILLQSYLLLNSYKLRSCSYLKNMCQESKFGIRTREVQNDRVETHCNLNVAGEKNLNPINCILFLFLFQRTKWPIVYADLLQIEASKGVLCAWNLH